MASLVVAIGVFEGTVGIQAVPQLAGHVAQPSRIEPSGCFQQDGLGVANGFAPDLLGGPGDHPHVSLGDLAGREGLRGAR